jgi:hypothetical protein
MGLLYLLFQEFRAKWQLSNLLWHFKMLRFDQTVYVYFPVIVRGSAGSFPK